MNAAPLPTLLTDAEDGERVSLVAGVAVATASRRLVVVHRRSVAVVRTDAVELAIATGATRTCTTRRRRALLRSVGLAQVERALDVAREAQEGLTTAP